MLEKLKPLRSTPTGIYFRMADGRIGYANHQYARVSVTREGIIDGKYYKNDCEIGDRMYQINKKINYPHNEIPSVNMVGRVRYNDISEAISALQLFNCKNCGEGAIEYRKNKILKEYKEHKALNIRSILTRQDIEDEGGKICDAYNRGHDDGRENGYNDGFRDGVQAMEKKLNKLISEL
jgi:hypothetical protein